jgi:hypothetical protein
MILAGILTSELLPEGFGRRRADSAALPGADSLADARPPGESPEQPAVWALAQDGAVWLPHGRRPPDDEAPPAG